MKRVLSGWKSAAAGFAAVLLAPAFAQAAPADFYKGRTVFVTGGAGTINAGIAKGFAEAMGGSVSAANRLDRSGAVFTLSLPAGPALAAVLPAALPELSEDADGG